MRNFLTAVLISILTLLQNYSVGQNSVNMSLADSSSVQLALRFTDTLLLGGDHSNAITLAQRILDHCQTNADTTGRNYKAGLEKMGLGHYYLGNYPLAVQLYRHALSLYSITEREANAAAYAATQYRVGLAYHYLGQNDSALVWHMAALHGREAIQPIDSNSLASSYNGIGMAFDATDQPDQALEWYGKATKTWKSVKGYWNRNTANGYNNIGITYHTIGRYEEALKYKLEALRIRQKILGPDEYDTGASWLNLGATYHAIGQLDKSANALAEAYRIWSRILPPEHPNLALLMDNTGITLMDMGDFTNAEKWLKDALKSRLDNYGYDSPETCKPLTNLGVLAGKTADYSAAIDYQLKATYLFQKSAGNEYELMVAYSNIGVFYSDLEEHQNALLWLEKALELSNKIESVRKDMITDIYYNMGIAFQGLQLFDKALEYKQRAHNEALIALGDTNTHYINYTEGLGRYYRDTKDYDKASNYFEKALQLRAKQAGLMSMNYAMVMLEIAQVKLLADEIEHILPLLQHVEYIVHYHNPNGASSDLRTWMRIKYLYAQYFQSRYELDKRLEDYEQAAVLYNGMRDTFLLHLSDMNGVESWRYWTNFIYPAFGDAIKLYTEQYLHNHQKESVAQAWLFSESAKSLLLLKAINDEKVVNFNGIPDSIITQERLYRVQITFLEKLRQEMIASGKIEQDSLVLSVSSQITDYRQKVIQVRDQLNQHASQYVSLRYNLNQIPLLRVSETLVGKNQALLEYFVGDSSIFLFVVRPDTMIVQEVKRDFPLEEWIEGLRYGIYGHYAADKAIQTDSLKADAKRHYLEFAPKLYQKLVAPVAQHLPEKVILVPDGPLGYVPFDALLESLPQYEDDFKSYPYLLKKYQFSYTYSATLLREMNNKKHRQAPPKPFLGFAPFFTGDQLAFEQEYGDVLRKGFAPLPYTREEVGLARKKMGGDVVVGQSATEEQFLEIASQYSIIHLATHGVADNRVGDYAYLVFGDHPDSFGYELLYIKDLYNLSLNADLVVLSACETGIGKLQRGEGIISLARAFAYAGAKSMVTSLWSVSNKSTSELMALFYDELALGKEKDAALREARLRYIKNASVKNSHPFFWAAFVPIGDMRPVR